MIKNLITSFVTIIFFYIYITFCFLADTKELSKLCYLKSLTSKMFFLDCIPELKEYL